MPEVRKKTRCAIYTRKSTEDGLEQDFNSLDAQREACAAYILSQTHEGWERTSELYDDGGFSGGSMERPGLKQLLQDVIAGKVDVIVVYKVDRLTRSLADFAKIVDILDEHDASFVSVKLALGSTTFSAQYQQCPVPSDGEVVRWGWFRRYAAPPGANTMTIHQSWDTASKAEEHHDFSVCTTWGTIGDDIYLLDVDRARRDFPSLKRRIVELARQWKTRTILIEDKGAGTSLIQQLRTEHHGIPYPTAFLPKDDKLTRLHAQSARIEAGHVFLPERAAWLEELRIEIASFPQGRHDDQVDSISQFLAWFFARRSGRMRQVPISGI